MNRTFLNRLFLSLSKGEIENTDGGDDSTISEIETDNIIDNDEIDFVKEEKSTKQKLKTDNLNFENIPELLAILPVRNTVLMPGIIMPVTVSRPRSVKMIKKINKGDKYIGVIAQRDPKINDTTTSDLYEVGTIAKILKVIVLPDGNTTIIIQGKSRFKINEVIQEDPFAIVKYDILKDNYPKKLSKEQKALLSSIKDASALIIKLSPDLPMEAQIALDNLDEGLEFLTNFLTTNLSVEVKDKQKLIETNNGIERSTTLLQFLLQNVQLLELKQEINNRVHSELDQQQKDYFLRHQMKVIQDELGQDSPEQEVEKLRKRALDKSLPEYVMIQLNKEFSKLMRSNPQSSEYPISYNYCETILDLPWNETSDDNFDLKEAQKILDEDHSGLEKVKERIIEYLAVLKLKKDMKAPILCLYGPPGVGKTSLGKSIAKALNRKYVRMALGGLRDEAEIRGHRKTYIGAQIGRVLQSMKKAGSNNPVFVLDEIDKLGNDFRGDPSSALLEVLDPEQNAAFYDNYLELDYDLSKVLFIATANSLDSIHPALRDRMDILEVNGYSVEEKIDIVKKHILPKQKKDHGLTPRSVNLADESIKKIIESYTSESGVRGAERQVGNVIRKIAKNVAMDEKYPKTLRSKDIVRLLGPELIERDQYQDNTKAGVVIGLAWTQVGGDILYIESNLSKGKGKITLSGQLGDVMKESAMTALSWLKANASDWGIDNELFEQYDLHIHFPAGSVPKDGPSAGITIATSLASIYTQRKIKQALAMTGEITLRGKVLPVGGIKEKVLAAKRAGIKEIIMSVKNKKDVQEIKSDFIEGLNFHYVESVTEVLKLAIMNEKVDNFINFVISKDKQEIKVEKID